MLGNERSGDEDYSTIQSSFNLMLDSPPSCLEFVPVNDVYPNHFVVGTYSLHTDEDVDSANTGASQSRSGSLLLFSLEDQKLELLNTESTLYAVLDLHFSSEDDKLFAVATSVGAVDLYQLSDRSNRMSKHYLNPRLRNSRYYRISKVVSPKTCELTAWHVGQRSPKFSDWGSSIGVSLSNGQVGYISYTDSNQVIRLKHTHSMEAWTIAWSDINYEDHSHHVLYSGGDDSVLSKNVDSHNQTRCEDPVLHFPLEALSRDTKTHNAGVTAILPIRIRESKGQQVAITGSYDEYVRVLCLANGLGRSQVLAEERMHGGGVWRLKLLGCEEDGEGAILVKVLASCMHAGPRILYIYRSSSQAWSVRVVAKFMEHGSMNYGSDARKSLPTEKPGLIVVSTSFYDKKLCVWNFDPD